jgi:hypothetical protein
MLEPANRKLMVACASAGYFLNETGGGITAYFSPGFIENP